MMRVLLTTGIGSRGDVQPLVALAMRLKETGQEARFCVPPDFRDWIEGLGFPVTPIGSPLRGPGSDTPHSTRAVPQGQATGTRPDRLRPLTHATFADQFTTLAEAAEGCDAIVVTALQVAARSVAEMYGSRYVFATFCPAFLPSPHHPPPPFPASGPEGPAVLWSRHARRFNETFGPALNHHRAAVGLSPVEDVRSHIFTSRPWLAADPVLAPWTGPSEQAAFQTGAWILPDERPLDDEVQAFLQAGKPPLYFGFGSMRIPPSLPRAIIQAARHTHRRVIISAGSVPPSLPTGDSDVLVIGEANQQQLFKRVAVVVHHGGAGTTTAAALAGTPQVVIPQTYDQHYWAQRVCDLGIGTVHAPGILTVESLTAALTQALWPCVTTRARAIGPTLTTNGTHAAAMALDDHRHQSPYPQ